MKKTHLTFLTLLCTASLTACGGQPADVASSSDADVNGASESTAPEKTAVQTIDISNCEPAEGVTGFVDSAAGASSSGVSEDLAAAPESGTGYRSGMQEVKAASFAASTANPEATKAACQVLMDGGSAADAAIAAQFVLGLVEPQSSGIGGGGYILYSDAKTGKRIAIDGREVAPVSATETYLIQKSDDNTDPPVPDARRSGRSIGVPGIVAALGVLHEQYGKQDWADLISPAADMAANGFEVSPRLAALVADNAEDLQASPNAAAYFFDEQGTPISAGTMLKNQDYADTLQKVAHEGSGAFYTGELAKAIVEESTRDTDNMTPSQMTTADLAAYTPNVTEPLCGEYKEYEVCGMPPSSSGGIAVVETLRLLNDVDLAQYKPDSPGVDGALPAPEAIHLVSEAERLAYADRDAYVGDPAFVEIPGGPEALLADAYTSQRAELIDPDASAGKVEPGVLEEPVGAGVDIAENGTTHINVIDSEGNAAAITSSVEAAFGSFHFTNGFVLNNQLTDFNAEPLNEDGTPAANRVEGAKRPRSSMSPTLLFNEDGSLAMALGSPGGSLIIQYVIKTLLGITDWDMNVQQAISAPNFGARNQPETNIGNEHPDVSEDALAETVDSLQQKGHSVELDELTSGLSALRVTPDGIYGGADPRREGIVLGG